MIETVCRIFDPAIACDAWCVTTNCTLDRDGRLVMGAGTALAAKKMFPELPVEWGAEFSRTRGGVMVTNFPGVPYALVSFPTKIDWRDASDLHLISASAHQLVRASNEHGWSRVMLPRPGCSNGRLSWSSEVRPIIANLLDDRFTVFSRGV